MPIDDAMLIHASEHVHARLGSAEAAEAAQRVAHAIRTTRGAGSWVQAFARVVEVRAVARARRERRGAAYVGRLMHGIERF